MTIRCCLERNKWWIMRVILFSHSLLDVVEWGAICNNQKCNFPHGEAKKLCRQHIAQCVWGLLVVTRKELHNQVNSVSFYRVTLMNCAIIRDFLSKMCIPEMFIQRRSSPSWGERCRKKWLHFNLAKCLLSTAHREHSIVNTVRNKHKNKHVRTFVIWCQAESIWHTMKVYNWIR